METTILGLGFRVILEFYRDITPTTEKQMEKKMDNEMETGIL